jgi:predicted metal-dependent HD superfamily phosphohydrolase
MRALDPQRWESLWRQLGGSAPAGSFAELERLYGGSDRHYHGTQHILACLAHLDRLHDLARAPAQVELALWLHDAIYDTHRQDNEAASAALARRWLGEAGLDRHGDALQELIMATCHQAAGLAGDAALVADIDLSILASAPPVYAEYQAAVRREYAWVPEELFSAGRAKVLRQLLDQPRLYQTPSLRQGWESRARENLKGELRTLLPA